MPYSTFNKSKLANEKSGQEKEKRGARPLVPPTTIDQARLLAALMEVSGRKKMVLIK